MLCLASVYVQTLLCSVVHLYRFVQFRQNLSPFYCFRIEIFCLKFQSRFEENLKRKEINMSADSELSSILNRRQQINDALENGESVTVKQNHKIGNIFTEFHEFTRKEIKDYQATFNR